MKKQSSHQQPSVNKVTSISKPRSLDVLMKGTAVLDVKSKCFSSTTTATTLAKPMKTLEEDEENKIEKIEEDSSLEDRRKPAIASVANTTKILKLERRSKPKKKKQYNVLKKKEKKSDDMLKRESTFSSESMFDNQESTSSGLSQRLSTLSTTSVKNRLQSFEKNDEEFYKIINQITKENSGVDQVDDQTTEEELVTYRESGLDCLPINTSENTSISSSTSNTPQKKSKINKTLSNQSEKIDILNTEESRISTQASQFSSKISSLSSRLSKVSTQSLRPSRISPGISQQSSRRTSQRSKLSPGTPQYSSKFKVQSSRFLSKVSINPSTMESHRDSLLSTREETSRPGLQEHFIVESPEKSFHQQSSIRLPKSPGSSENLIDDSHLNKEKVSEEIFSVIEESEAEDEEEKRDKFPSEEELNMHGSKMILAEKQSNNSYINQGLSNNITMSQLPSTIPFSKDTGRSVHHFCTQYYTQNNDIPWTKYLHTPSKYEVVKSKPINKIYGSPDNIQKELNGETLEYISDEQNEGERRLSLLAERIMSQIEEDQKAGEEEQDQSFLKLQDVVNELFHEKEQQNGVMVDFEGEIIGDKMNVHENSSNTKLFQTPAPPKFRVPPQEVTKVLAPDYVSFQLTEENLLENMDIDEVAQTNFFIEDRPEDEKEFVKRLINRRHNSAIELHPEFDIMNLIGGEGIKDDDVDHENEAGEESGTSSEDDEADENCSLESSYKFESIIDHRRKINRSRPGSAESSPYKEQPKSLKKTPFQESFQRSHSQPDFIIRQTVETKPELKSDYRSLREENKELANLLGQMTKENKEIKRLEEEAERYRLQKRNTIIQLQSSGFADECLSRAQSLDDLAKFNVVQPKKAMRRSQSESALEELEREIMEDVPEVCDLSWFKDNYWYPWLDESYKDQMTNSEQDDDSLCFRLDKEISRSSSVANTSGDDEDQWVYRKEVFTEADQRYQKIVAEIEDLTKKIEESSNSNLIGFHYCRRGACYRKVGDLQNAIQDLNTAIKLESKLIDAYWHRHLVYLLKNDVTKALEDLSHITTVNHDYCNAYKSRAEIFIANGDVALAISSYSQAIRIKPKSPELYYARAELLEERGDIILALEDYKSANQHDQTNTNAIKKIGMYHFKTKSWIASVNDFTELLSREPKNAEAFLFRGCANSKMFNFEAAIRDFSISISLQPDNYLPFYHRACLLRKVLPKQAIRDFSVSLLLDSSLGNVSSFIHRGILYAQLERYDQARWDFESAIRLDRSLAPVHVNIGVLDLKANDMTGALKRFNIAIRMDPTYVRAYLCRAESYEKEQEYQEAIKDYTRAIHMQPDVTEYRVSRGRLLLKLGNLELARFHIRQCAAMNTNKTSSPTQQAAVETFLQNYSTAISILETAVKSEPSSHFVTLLAKTKMKAKLFPEAIESFNKAIAILKPWNPKNAWPKEAGDAYFNIGICYVEMKKFSDALDSFNSCLKINPELAEAYFHRGLTKMKLGLSKGVHDFNRTLVHKPKYYQAYLGRASYYGSKKRYAKAIMNCNEALRLHPNSVRALVYRGAIKFHIKAYKLAIKDLSEAIGIDSNCMLAYFNRAVCFHQKRYFFKALRDYSIVLMSDCNLRMKALLNRGLLYFQINDVENALCDFLVGLKEFPDNPRIHHTVGLCYHRLKQHEKATEFFTSSLEVDPFFSHSILARGNVLMDSFTNKMETGNDKSNLREKKIARRDYIRALHLNPLSKEARINLAYSLQDEGQYMKAWHMFTRTIDISPGHQRALEGRAIVSLHMGNAFGALVDMNSALNSGKNAELLCNRGIVHQALGDVVNAMNDYQSAIRTDPSYALAYYNAANVYFFHKQYAQAIGYYTRACEWQKTDAYSFVNRAVTRSLTKDFKGALEDFAEAEKHCPDWALIYYNRAHIHNTIGQLDKAHEDLSNAIRLQPNDALAYKKRADVKGALGMRQEALQDYRMSLDLAYHKK